MPTNANEYVSAKGLGNFQELQVVMREFAESVRFFNNNLDQRRATFEARILLSSDDVADECLDINEIIPHTRGVYPVLWVNVTFDPDRLRQAEISELEHRFSLLFLGSVSADYDFR